MFQQQNANPTFNQETKPNLFELSAWCNNLYLQFKQTKLDVYMSYMQLHYAI